MGSPVGYVGMKGSVSAGLVAWDFAQPPAAGQSRLPGSGPRREELLRKKSASLSPTASRGRLPGGEVVRESVQLARGRPEFKLAACWREAAELADRTPKPPPPVPTSISGSCEPV